MLGSTQCENSGSFEEQIISERMKGISVAAAVLDDENGDRNSETSPIEQYAVLSDSVICENSLMVEIKVSTFFFWKSMSQKTTH